MIDHCLPYHASDVTSLFIWYLCGTITQVRKSDSLMTHGFESDENLTCTHICGAKHKAAEVDFQTGESETLIATYPSRACRARNTSENPPRPIWRTIYPWLRGQNKCRSETKLQESRQEEVTATLQRGHSQNLQVLLVNGCPNSLQVLFLDGV